MIRMVNEQRHEEFMAQERDSICLKRSNNSIESKQHKKNIINGEIGISDLMNEEESILDEPSKCHWFK